MSKCMSVQHALSLYFNTHSVLFSSRITMGMAMMRPAGTDCAFWPPVQVGRAFSGFPSGWGGKECTCNAGDLGSVPGLGRSPGERDDNPLQYSCLEIPWTEGPGGAQSMGSQRV